MIKNKKAFELVFSTWVILVLSILVLIFLVIFFTTSSGSFLNNIKGYFSKTNIDSVIKSCNLLTDTNSGYEFCCEKKSVIYYEGSGKKEIELSCSEFSNLELSNDLIKKNIDCNDYNCGLDSTRLNEENCNSAGGKWNDCGSKCSIMNPGRVCPEVCDAICECGTIGGLTCPENYICKIPPGNDMMGYCESRGSEEV
jgi:hypothetical protein